MKKTYSQIEEDVQRLLNTHSLDNIDFVVGISRGGLIPAMVISTKLVKPLVVAYIDKWDNVYFDRDEWIFNRNVLVVDDIVRTGKTINKITRLMLHKGAKLVETFTPYTLESGEYRPTFTSFVKEDIDFPWDNG